MKINGYTRLAAVVANPIKHSISPFIHNTAFEQLGINGVYLAFEIEDRDLEETIRNIRRYNMWGINLSMPYKDRVLPYLDDLDESAALFGTVNTIVNREGRLIGYNTDGLGFFRSLPSEFQLIGSEITLLGGKGAATAILSHAALHGAKCLNVFCKGKYLEETQKRLSILKDKSEVVLSVNALEDTKVVQEKILDSDLVVNAGSQGMDGVSMPVSSDIKFSSHQIVADIIYQPFETPFLKLARSQGNQTVNGLGMLLYQAAAAFKLWTNCDMPTEAIWQQLENIYQS